MFIKKIVLIYFTILGFINALAGQGQDTSKINLNFNQGKEILIKESSLVLSKYYDISIAEADLQQRRLWNNPTFVWNADLYSVEHNKYFEFSNQKLIQLEYVFSVSGKRIKAIKQAKLGIDIAKLAYADVIRGIVLEYSLSFTKLSNLIEKAQIYNTSIAKYELLITSFEKRLSLGLVSESDLVRLKSALIMLRSEASELQNEIFTERSNLNTLLNFPPSTIITPVQNPFSDINEITYDNALSVAKEHRPDFQIAQKNIGFYEQDLKIQKANAIPDIKIGYQPHDKGSNYVRPYQGMVFEMGIPIFNRNQGEISKSKIRIEQSKLDLGYFDLKMQNEVQSSVLNYKNSKVNLLRYSDRHIAELDKLINDANSNFERKNISLLQYMDYHQNYIDVRLKYADARYEYLNSVNELNFIVGKEITN